MILRKLKYVCFVICLLVGQAALSTSTISGQVVLEPRQEKNINSVLRNYGVATLSTNNLAKQARDGQIIPIRTATRSFDLKVEPYDIRSANYKAVEALDGGATRELKAGPITTFKGTIVGQPKTDVRLSIVQNKMEGVIITPTEQIYIEPLKHFDKRANEASFVIYDKSDVLENVDLTLDERISDVAAEYAPASPQTNVSAPPQTNAVAAVREIEIATETDYEYVQTLGGSQAANNEILGILNQVDGIYRRDLGLTVRVVYQHTWATSNDPYGAGLNSLLDEFRTYWEANFTNIRRDVAHIWTNNSESNIAGLAYFGVMCRSASLSYGLSKRLDTTTTRTIVTAHEIGHNVGAEHVQGGSCDNTIMNPGLGSGTQTTFCQTSRDQIGAYVNQNSSCLSESGGGGIIIGAVYALHNQCSDKVADVAGVSQADGAPIHLWTYFGGANQQFKAQDAGGGNFSFIAQHSGKAMDVQSSGTTNGTLVWQYTPNQTSAQRWNVVDAGGGFYKLLPQSSPGKALDVSGASTADGAKIQIWTDNGTCAQKWRFEQITTP